jgi:uncharacterized protein (TIGR02596 family)
MEPVTMRIAECGLRNAVGVGDARTMGGGDHHRPRCSSRRPIGACPGFGRRSPWAFALIELLVVISIILSLMVLIVPAVNGIGGAYAITRQGETLNDQFVQARQIATSRNRDIEMRFYFETPAPNKTTWGVQLWELNSAGQSPVPCGKMMKFSEAILMNLELSPLLKSQTLPSGQAWYALRFRANGRIAGQWDNKNNYLTIQHRTADALKPANYFTLQINPITGSVSTYRP